MMLSAQQENSSMMFKVCGLMYLALLIIDALEVQRLVVQTFVFFVYVVYAILLFWLVLIYGQMHFPDTFDNIKNKTKLYVVENSTFYNMTWNLMYAEEQCEQGAADIKDFVTSIWFVLPVSVIVAACLTVLATLRFGRRTEMP